MNWVKQNYDRLLLAVAALVLAGTAALLLLNVHAFNGVFLALQNKTVHKAVIPPDNRDAINVALEGLAKPATWEIRTVNGNRQLPLFVSVPYIAKTIVDPDGNSHEALIDPLDDDPSKMLHPPVPNSWLIDNKQALLDDNVLNQDTDGDGFTTLDEWMGSKMNASDHTDPMNKDSHPPYWTKVFLKRFVRIPFRLRFDARNGNVVLLNTIDDPDAATQFLRVGDLVKGTKFKVTDLKIKSTPINGINKDTSEVTLTNTDSNEKIVLAKEEEVDSPTTYALMTYLWTGKDFALRKGQEFFLKPEDNVKYRCLDLNATEVTFQREDTGAIFKVKPLPPPQK